MNKKNPQISVVIPVYNTEECLRECLDSVVNQTLKDIEIILIDDGSTDNSSKICDEYAKQDTRIKVFHQENKGAALSRNKGIDIAQGEYLYFLDSDDYMASDMLEKMLNKIEQEDAEICVCNYYNIFEGKEISFCKNSIQTDILSDKNCFNIYDFPEKFFQICSVFIWIKLYKKSFIKENNIKYQNLSDSNDIFFSIKSMVLAKKITYLKEALIFYRRNRRNSTTINKTPNNFLKAAKKSETFLKEIKIFKQVENSFYNYFLGLFYYILASLNSKLSKIIIYIEAFNFFPSKYFASKIIQNFIQKIKQKIIYLIYIILLKLGIKDIVKNFLQKLGYKFDE